MAFEAPEVLATLDRSYGDKKEVLRLERGMYQDKPTFTLRLHWQAPDGKWRWSSQKPTQSGKCWERLNIKQRELRELGEALIAAADDSSVPSKAPDFRSTGGGRPEPRSQVDHRVLEVEDDDIPF